MVLGLGEDKQKKKKKKKVKTGKIKRQKPPTRRDSIVTNARQLAPANNINSINSVCLKAQTLVSCFD